MGKTGRDAFPHSFTLPLSFRLDATASRLLLFCLLNGFQVLFRVKLLKTSLTDLPRGWIAMSGRVCGIAWGSI